MILLKILHESFRFAIQALIGNKLRTLLSLLGVTIGIFAIISVFAVVDSLERNIRNNVDSLGDNVVFVTKWPWAMDGEYPWWKYYQRPVPTFKELPVLEQRLEMAEAVAFVAGAENKTAKFESNDVEGIGVAAVSHAYQDVYGFELSSGRYFSLLESATGKPVAVVGSNIVEELFKGDNPLGKVIRFMGQKVLVVGVFEKAGDSIIGNSDDDNIVIPVKFARNFMRLNSESVNPMFMVKAKQGVTNDQLKDDLTRVMRSVRRLSPKSDDDFALNEISILSKGIDVMFRVIDLAGIIIGGFSLLVGGFGIANIMFVSVKERTNIIGIQKAIGARNYFILLQFLFEAILLCLIGGALGLLLVYTGTVLANNYIEFDVALSVNNIFTGLCVSILIGVISGIIPALSAARLDPVEAIRSGQ
ncbi:MAG: ABC transporter permease [Flavobacteriales bacterium]|nr:ABC transporter permease [Flavobacteriales bacterium]